MSIQPETSPYFRLMRLHQPTGIFLLLWPCLWSLAFSYGNSFDLQYLYYLGLFATGAIIMRSSGCVINDIIDRKIDAEVERTKTRPLASGELRLWQAIVLLVILLSIGLAILLTLNWLTIQIGIGAVIMISLYPLMKRITYWPQAFLAITFNLGAIMAWTAINNEITITPILIYFSCILWTLGYDTIYAHQDKSYDEKIGIKSTALKFKNNTKIYLTLFYGTLILLLLYIGILNNYGILYKAIIILALTQLFWQVCTVNLDSPGDCMKKFKSNTYFGAIVFFSILLDNTLRNLFKFINV